MIILTSITDPLIIKKMLRIDDIYKGIFGINQLPCKFIPCTKKWTWSLVFNNQQLLGLLMYSNYLSHVYFHGAMFKKYRNHKTKYYLQEALNKIPGTKYYTVFKTTVHKTNNIALKLISSLDFKETMFDGEYYHFSEV